MNFCDYCSCDTCKNGEYYLAHARTVDGKYICDVCYWFDICRREPFTRKRHQGEPCENKNCEHRPKLISKWTKYSG